MKKILVATHNPGKVREYAELLDDLAVEWLSLDDLGISDEVDETGATFEENAWLKGRAYVQASGLLTLADDSGLEVDALNGEPGIYSARYGGVKGAAQHKYLLDKLVDVPKEQRTARFRCFTVVCTPDGQEFSSQGSVEGRIGFEPVGTHGFGYDPLFFMPQFGKTMAQLEPALKNRISHRAQALAGLKPVLERLVAE